MAQPLDVSEIQFTAATPDFQRTGLLGWISCVFGRALQVDGIALRRTAEGQFTLSFPARKDRQGQLHPVVRPLDDLARIVIETQVFDALRLEEGTK